MTVFRVESEAGLRLETNVVFNPGRLDRPPAEYYGSVPYRRARRCIRFLRGNIRNNAG